MFTTILIGMTFFCAGIIQGMTGFGSALIAIPLLCLIIDIKAAVPLSVLNGIIITSYLGYKLRADFDWRKLKPLCLASLPGIVVGVTVLKHVESAIISTLLGLFIVSYACYSLAFSPAPRDIKRIWAYCAGFCSGAIGSAFSAGGPPVIIYTTLTKWKKNEIKATMTGFFLFNSSCIVAAHLATGLTTTTVLFQFLLSVPFVLAGTMLGSFCYGLINRKLYLRVVSVLLIGMGIMMIITR